MRFHIYHLIARCTVHGRGPIDQRFLQDTATVSPAKLYTKTYLVMMETCIADFHTSLYILAI